MNVLIVYGGKSCEHDISVITACLARGYFVNHNVIGCYLDRDNNAFFVSEITPQQHTGKKFTSRITFVLGQRCIEIRNKIGKKRIHIDCAVNCCHGVNGEDGAVAGLLQLCGIPDAESGVLCCGSAMDKYLTKLTLRSLGINVVDGVLLTDDNLDKVLQLGFPLIVKPSTLGSSIGIGVAHDVEQLEHCISVARQFDNRVLVEKAIENFTEINCSAMTVKGQIVTSATDFPLSANEILTFADKYLNGGKGMADGKKHVTDVYDAEIKRITEKIYREMGFGGVIRVDFIASADKLYVNEINTVPGSLAYGMWKEVFSPAQFGDNLLQEGLATYNGRQKLTYRFRSDVLTRCAGSKVKG